MTQTRDELAPLQNSKERGRPQAHLFTSHTKNEATEELKALRRVLT